MRYPVLFSLLLISLATAAQDLTGVWRGDFVNGIGVMADRYKYEVQIKQLPNKSLQGVTYSYLNTSFYGKAACQGIYMDKVNNIVLKETKLLDLRSESNAANIMTCYLSYRKENGVEYLEGTYSSVSTKDGMMGNSGKVRLKRVPESDFQKEDFLTGGTAKKGGIKPGAEANLLPKSAPKRPMPPAVRNRGTFPGDSLHIQKQDGEPFAEIAPAPPIERKLIPVPQILKQRENKLVKTIITNTPDIKIQLYDNGEIDNDTVTVYHNNEPTIFKRRLSYDPLTINVTATRDNNIHEFYMIADNLGTIPPNTAYMVIFTGGKRYELSVTADMKKNAKIVIEYKP